MVAGFDVFGNVGHQLNSRLYMDFLRMEGEDDFLLLLPPDTRQALRKEWYKGNRGRRKSSLFEAPEPWTNVELVTGFTGSDPQRELNQAMERRLGDLAGPADHLNRCADPICTDPEWDEGRKMVAESIQKLTRLRGERLSSIPDVTFIRVRNLDGEDAAYTALLNKGYSHVTSIFSDEQERDVDDDTLTVVEGFVGAYPNFFLTVNADAVSEFVKEWLAIENRVNYEQFAARYGVRRTNPQFWMEADWFYDKYAHLAPIESGLFDLSRYQNR